MLNPGFLTAEYYRGRRTRYLNPVRLYIFISAVFFLVLFSGKKNSTDQGTQAGVAQGVQVYRQQLADSLRKLSAGRIAAGEPAAAALYRSLADHLDTGALPPDTTESVNGSINNEGEIVFHLREGRFATTGAYEEVQQHLPPSKRDAPVTRYMTRKLIYLTHVKYSKPELVISHDIGHDIPRIMFFLLPIFALFTGFFYRKQSFGYGQHVIFSLHFHSFVFLFLMVAGFAESPFINDRNWYLIFLFNFAVLFGYLGAALHGAYRQSIWLSLVKATAITLLYAIALVLAFGVLVAVSFMLLG